MALLVRLNRQQRSECKTNFGAILSRFADYACLLMACSFNDPTGGHIVHTTALRTAYVSVMVPWYFAAKIVLISNVIREFYELVVSLRNKHFNITKIDIFLEKWDVR